MKIKTLLLFIICSFYYALSAQISQEVEGKTPDSDSIDINISSETYFKPIAKVEFGVGIGIDHSILGIKAQYLITNNISLYSSLGVAQLLLHTPVVGVQYNFNLPKYKKIQPYVFTQIGKDLSYVLRNYDATTFMDFRRTKRFISVNTGMGIKYRHTSHSLITWNLGISYRMVNTSKIETFIDNFNEDFGSDYSGVTHNDFLPILGWHINLNQLKRLKDRLL